MLKKIKDWIGSNLDVYKVESASDVGAGLYRHIWKGRENATQIGTTLNAEIMNNLQNSLVHSINATKTTGTGTDYYICNLDGLTEFGLNNDLKLRITVDNANTNTTTKLRLNNVDYTLLKEQNGTLKQIEAGDIHSNKTYELIYNGSQFVVINLFKNFESSYLDNCIKKTDFAEENKAGIISLSAVKGLIPNVPNAAEYTNGTVNLRQIKDMIDTKVPNATHDTAGKVMLGTTANTALEGNRLAEIIGMEFGGKIQDSGIKTAGKFYYDTVTKFYYECIANNNLTYNDSSKFRAISNKPISDRVENLFKKTDSYYKIGELIIQSGIIGYKRTDGANGTIGNFNIPFPSKCLSIMASDVWNGVNRVSISDISLTQFKCWGKDASDNFNNTTIRWIAFGY